MVLMLQLGIPISVQGVVGAVVLVATVVTKPLVSALADTFSTARRGIFVFSVLLTCLSLTCMAFIPQFGKSPLYPTAWLVGKSILHHKVSTEEKAVSENVTNYNVMDLMSENEKYSLFWMNNTIFDDLPASDSKSPTKMAEAWENTVLVLPLNGGQTNFHLKF